MTRLTMRTLFALTAAVFVLLAPSLVAQCPAGCQPSSNGKTGPIDPSVVVAFGAGFSYQNIDAFVSGMDMWNLAFLGTWTDLRFTTTGNSGPHIWIEIDPWLPSGAYNATDANGYGTIFVSPNELSRSHDFLAHLMAHELGHSLGFANNFGSASSSNSCAGYTIMYGNLSPSGPFHSSIPQCDSTAVSNTYPTTMDKRGTDLPDCPDSPIVLDLSNDGYRMTSLDDGVYFDLRNEGIARRVAWTKAGAANAFLAWDRNGNGVIDHGGELFGNHTPLRSGVLARHGFEALAEFDDNGDGFISASDRIWGRLVLWTDRDHNGLSTADELQTISASIVTRLEIRYQPIGRRDQWGNYFPYMAHYHMKHGSRAYYDVFLRVAE